MAKLSLDLSQFKAAGVYTVEVDQSERITVTTQSLRLVVGFSKIGPFNAPTFIRSTRDRARFFGDIDKKLEKKGSFFQRSIDTCLLQAPVFALNLLNVDNSSTNFAEFVSLSLDASASNPGVFSDAFINFYNRERFWKPDPDYLLGVAGNKEGVPGSAESTSLLQVANVGTKRVSVIVRKAVGLQGYDVTAKDWYGSNIPYKWIRPYDLMKDYFIQVIAIEGDWTNYTNLSSDPFFSSYFNTKGVIPAKLNEFINLPQVSLVGSWIGTFIPDFRDQTGANQNIEDIVNASTPLTGVMVNVNQDALDQLIWDEESGQWEMGDGSDILAAGHLVDLVGHGFIDQGINKVEVSYDAFISPAIWEASVWYTDASATIPIDVSVLISPAVHTISTGTTQDVSIFISDAVYTDVSLFSAPNASSNVRVFVSPAIWEPSTLTGVDGVSIQSNFLSYDVSVLNEVIHNTLTITTYQEGTTTGKKFYLDNMSDANKISIGTLVKKDEALAENGIPGVTYVISKIFTDDISTYGSPTGVYVLQTAEPIDGGAGATTITTQMPIDDASVATCYKFLALDGLKLTSNHLPGYTTTGTPNAEEGLEKIYSMLEDEGILRGLTNPEMINYRYVVDTMAYGLRPNLGGKVYLSRLAKKRGKTTAIISAPSMTQFATSQDPYFCDVFVSGVDPKPIFSTEYIPVGGNPDMPRSFRFTLPDEDNGSKFTGVFGPFLKYTENDKVILVPPAADISNSFVRKFLGGDPYAIVANKNGIISNPNLAGVEYMLDKEDRSYLEPFGYNSIIERTSTGEVLIYANRTAYQTVKSDFNYLHVRELLNTIELQVEEVLKNYVFDFNNPVTRLTIINAVNPILESMKDAGALSNYQIIMDESNNTPDIVDEGLAIIDIGVWVTKGMEKIIQRITVYKTGGVSTGGNSTL